MATVLEQNSLRAEAEVVLEHCGVPRDLRARFWHYLANAPAAVQWHANPRYLAEQLAFPVRPTLRLLLAAVHAGLARLHWDVQCPRCSALTHREAALPQLHREETCAACRHVFPQRLDVEIRVTFSTQLSGRPASADDDDPILREAIDGRLGVVSGQELLVLPEFRDLFPREKLLPGESLEVARAAFTFTDLAGSTALYAAQGDPRAFHLIRLHFDALAAAADQHGGAVVKNIGDSIMAAFQTPADALAASLAMHAAVDHLNRRLRLDPAEQLILKVGVHSGPCLNVTLNDRLDYFGTTVNIAARVQGLAQGCDIVGTDAVVAGAAAQALLSSRAVQSWRARLKGIDEELQLHRVTIGAAPARKCIFL